VRPRPRTTSQPRPVVLAGAQRAPRNCPVIDFPGSSVRVADEVLTAVGNAASDEHRPKDRACQLRDDTRRGPAHLAAASFAKPPLAKQSPPRAPGRVSSPRRHGPPESGEHGDREQNARIPLASTCSPGRYRPGERSPAILFQGRPCGLAGTCPCWPVVSLELFH
jgi:hypothetical protein